MNEPNPPLAETDPDLTNLQAALGRSDNLKDPRPTVTISLIRVRGAYDIVIAYPGAETIKGHANTKSAFEAVEVAIELVETVRFHPEVFATWQLDSYDDRPPKVIDRLGNRFLMGRLPKWGDG